MFTVKIKDDVGVRFPWTESDCYGVVSEGGDTSIPLHGYRHQIKRYLQRAATKELLGCDDAEVDRIAERLRSWFRDEWHYFGVIVTHKSTGIEESLWGIESDSGDESCTEIQYHIEELKADIASQVAKLREAALENPVEFIENHFKV